MFFFPYLFLFFFIILLFYSEKSLPNFNNGTQGSLRICIYYVFSLVIIIFICCRGYVGADWYNYKPFFENSPSLFDNNELIKSFLQKSEWGMDF